LKELWSGLAREVGYSLASPDWFLGMTDEFRKAISAVDRKLQGRILQAISYIAATPVAAKGDTVKPLSGDLKKLWRYRIGDYRLVYRPDEARRQVMLVAFTSRPGAYG
jgi:mRNA-degrading endonuclease RelE of RelBE toxin-antitoxin system